jgi:hypothetical protein
LQIWLTKWLKELQKQKTPAMSKSSGSVEQTPLDKLERLAKLHSSGALTDEEFNGAKEKILAAM